MLVSLYDKCKVLTNKQAYDILYDLCKSMSKAINNIPFVLNDTIPVGDGSTEPNAEYTFVDEVKIGCREFGPDGPNADNPVDEYLFMAGITTVYHERQHVEQYLHTFHEQSEFGRCLTLNHLATAGNVHYYQKNYYQMPCEVDAEYAGIIRAYKLCCDYLFGKDIAERLLCNYVNKKVFNDAYFISNKRKNFSNSHEIFIEMGNVLEKSLHSHRWYSLQNDAAYYIRTQPDGFEQDKMVTSIFLDESRYSSYSHVQRFFESIADMDLSCQTVLKLPNPKKVIWDLRTRKMTRGEIASERYKNIVKEDNWAGIG